MGVLEYGIDSPIELEPELLNDMMYLNILPNNTSVFFAKDSGSNADRITELILSLTARAQENDKISSDSMPLVRLSKWSLWNCYELGDT